MPNSVAIELFSVPACTRCAKAKQRVQNLVNSFDKGMLSYREIDVLEELDYAVFLGVMTTPSIAIQGELVFSTIPTEKKLRAEIEKRVASESSQSSFTG